MSSMSSVMHSASSGMFTPVDVAGIYNSQNKALRRTVPHLEMFRRRFFSERHRLALRCIKYLCPRPKIKPLIHAIEADGIRRVKSLLSLGVLDRKVVETPPTCPREPLPEPANDSQYFWRMSNHLQEFAYQPGDVVYIRRIEMKQPVRGVICVKPRRALVICPSTLHFGYWVIPAQEGDRWGWRVWFADHLTIEKSYRMVDPLVRIAEQAGGIQC